MKKIIILLLFILNFLNADISAYFPKLDGRVIDQANILSPDVKKDIDSLLKKHEDKTSNQIVVVILNSLNGYTIEDYSYQLGRFWGIGQKDKNNGVLLVVSMEDRKIRIEVGYGLEGALTDQICSEIIEYTIKPNFKANQFELGILKAVNEIIATIKGEYIAKNKHSDFSKNVDFPVFVLFFILFSFSSMINSISRKFRIRFLYNGSLSLIISCFFSLLFYLLSSFFTTYNFQVAIIVFILCFILFIIALKKVNFDELDEIDRIADLKAASEDNYSSSSSSSSYSGGGGSFGGGGASGSW